MMDCSSWRAVLVYYIDRYMSESTLLLRCKETIEDLNSAIRTHQHEISHLQAANKKLVFDMAEKQSVRIAMLEEINKLKRSIVEERMQFETKLNQQRLIALEGKKLLDEQELKYCELIKHMQRLEQENEALNQRLEGNRRLLKDWEAAIEDVNLKVKGLQAEKEVLERQNSLLKHQVDELKKECQINYRRAADWEDLAKRREAMEAEVVQVRGDVRKMAAELIEREKMYKALDDQNKRLLELLQQQKHTVSRFEEHIRIMEEQMGMRTESHASSRFASHNSQEQKPLSSVKQSSERFRSNSNYSIDGKQSEKPSKQLIPPYPHQSEPPTIESSDVRKRLEFTMGREKSEKRKSKQRTLQKLSRLEEKVKGIMQELRQ